MVLACRQPVVEALITAAKVNLAPGASSEVSSPGNSWSGICGEAGTQ